MDKYNYNYNSQKKEETENKLENMRKTVLDSEKCKEIAQKLCAYISKN